MFGNVLVQVESLLSEAADKENLYKDIAKCFKKMKTALVDEGFNEADATAIVIAIAGKK